MNKFFPIFLDLKGKNVLLIGAGPIAEQKASQVLGADGKLMVVAREIGPRFRKIAGRKNVKYFERPFRDSDLQGRDLVFCATNDETLNRRVGQLCRRKNILVNVVDRPPLCSFIMPAIVRRGDVIFAVSTGGVSPALAGHLRKKIESLFGNEVAMWARKLKKLRPKLLKIPMEDRKEILKNILKEY